MPSRNTALRSGCPLQCQDFVDAVAGNITCKKISWNIELWPPNTVALLINTGSVGSFPHDLRGWWGLNLEEEEARLSSTGY